MSRSGECSESKAMAMAMAETSEVAKLVGMLWESIGVDGEGVDWTVVD